MNFTEDIDIRSVLWYSISAPLAVVHLIFSKTGEQNRKNVVYIGEMINWGLSV